MAPTVLASLVFAAFSLYADAGSLSEALMSFNMGALGVGLLLATLNYALRFLRWELYLAVLQIQVPRGRSLLIFVSGFVMSITPGKLGEMYKSLLLKDDFDVPIARSAPVVIAERLTDVLALAVILAAGALSFPGGIAVSALTLLAILFIIALAAYRPLGLFVLRQLHRAPLISRLAPKLESAYDALHAMLRPAPLMLASLISTISWGLEVGSLKYIAEGFDGPVLTWTEHAFTYAASTLAGALAMLPGGLGATEAGMAGLLRYFGGQGMSWEVAASVTLLVRFATLWWAVILGAVGLAIYKATRRPTATGRAGSTYDGPRAGS